MNLFQLCHVNRIRTLCWSESIYAKTLLQHSTKPLQQIALRATQTSNKVQLAYSRNATYSFLACEDLKNCHVSTKPELCHGTA